mgnify:CR=1 FL=1
MQAAGAAVGVVLLFGLGAVEGGESVEPPSSDLRYVQEAATVSSRTTLIDSRTEASCRAATVPGAVCLPPEVFFGPHRRLASVRDISWVLGSAGLRGDEVVLVLGDDPVRRDAVAALLYLAGQSQVLVLNAPMDELAGRADAAWTPGRPRAILREPIHLGPWRDELIVLRDELADGIDDRLSRKAVVTKVVDRLERSEGIEPAVELSPETFEVRRVALKSGPGFFKLVPHQKRTQLCRYAHRALEKIG